MMILDMNSCFMHIAVGAGPSAGCRTVPAMDPRQPRHAPPDDTLGRVARVARPRSPATPPRWKLAALTWVGLLPTVLTVELGVRTVTGGRLHPSLHIAVIVTFVAPLMVWVVMPALTRSVSRWLYPTR
jgi:hypothetical protein